MFRKIQNWFKQDRRTMTNTNEFNFFREENDPRELPRPQKYLINNLSASSVLLKDNSNKVKSGKLCNCKNCQELYNCFSECIVCMEPLQCTAISSCMFCGNYTCWSCSEKVNNCPFCRINFQDTENRIRNFAIERVLLKLELPCRYTRWGCHKLLNHNDRIPHETNCLFAPTGCPLIKMCGWLGASSDIIRHLKNTHNLTLISSNTISIEIADFRVKLLNTITKPRLYNVSLHCFGNIYICKLKMQNQRLKMFFFQIVGNSVNKSKRYGAWLEISTASRRFKGAVEISPIYNNNKEMVISGQALICSFTEGDDLVKINITIKSIN